VAHQHYKGTGQMHSFRGLLADGGQDKIRIEGATGDIAWRITKFQIMSSDMPGTSAESVVQIWREEQTSASLVIDFSLDELLGAAYFSGSDSSSYTQDTVIIFDNALFVRNIYITHNDSKDEASANYYVELEEVKVSAAGMAQLAVAAARRLSA